MSTDLACAPARSPWATTWLGLPDPFTNSTCCRIQATEADFKHVISGHGDEPFSWLFGCDLAEALQGCFQPDVTPPCRHAVLAEAACLLGQEVSRTLRAGLVLAYDVTPQFGNPCTTWLGVLSCSAVVILHRYSEALYLRTLYFPRAGLSKHTPQACFAAVVARLVSRYAWMEVALNAIVPPRPDHTVLIRNEIRHNIRFNRLEAWGFRPDLDGCPWRGRPVIPAPASPALELRPRFRSDRSNQKHRP
jgi:hypothetical protein